MAERQEARPGHGDPRPLALSGRMDSGVQGSLRGSAIHYLHGEIRGHMVQRPAGRLRLRDLCRQRWAPCLFNTFTINVTLFFYESLNTEERPWNKWTDNKLSFISRLKTYIFIKSNSRKYYTTENSFRIIHNYLISFISDDKMSGMRLQNWNNPQGSMYKLIK